MIDIEDNDIDWFEEHVMLMKVFTERQRRAAVFLQERGLRFFYHFGVESCERLATEHGWQG